MIVNDDIDVYEKKENTRSVKEKGNKRKKEKEREGERERERKEWRRESRKERKIDIIENLKNSWLCYLYCTS